MDPHCPFCLMSSGNKEGQVVYSDEIILAVMDHRPVSKGHIIIFPRTHYKDIYEVPDDILAHLALISKKIALALKDAYSPPGLNIIQNNGTLAGQTVFHFHLHIIPRYDMRYLRYLISVARHRKIYPSRELEEQSNEIRKRLSNIG